VRVFLHFDVDQLQRRFGLLEHAPAFKPIVGTLHLVERNRGGVTHHQPAFAQVIDLEGGDFGIFFGVVVDEIVQIGPLVGVDALDASRTARLKAA